MVKLTKTGSLVAAALLAVLLAWAAGAGAAGVEVTAGVDAREVYVGEPFALTIEVDGDESPPRPDVSALEHDFDVAFVGGRRNSSTSISIMNGKMARVSHEGYVFQYELRARRPGELTIPAITVEAGGDRHRTVPIVIRAREPAERDDFSLEFVPARDSVYVGEPVEMKVIWRVGRDEVGDFSFNLPFLENDALDVRPVDAAGDPGSLVRVPVGGREVTAAKKTGLEKGRRVLTVTMTFVLRAKRPGPLTLAKGTVSCRYLAGYRRAGRRDPFSGFFDDDFFGMGLWPNGRKVYRTAVVPSNEPRLTVRPLPEKGRPPGFSGLVGEFSLAVNADPLEVKVGDPVTLTIQVAGEHAALARLPALTEQLEGAGFKVPGDMAPAVVDDSGMLKTFTQTVRARHDKVREIPALALDYFNPRTGRYETARSEPVPLVVHAVTKVTVADAERARPPSPAPKTPRRVEAGLHDNFYGSQVLVPQAPADMTRHPKRWLAALAVPPLFFLRRRQVQIHRSTRFAARRGNRSLAGNQSGQRVDGAEIFKLQVFAFHFQAKGIFDEEHQLHGKQRIDKTGGEDVFVVIQILLLNVLFQKRPNALFDIVHSCHQPASLT